MMNELDLKILTIDEDTSFADRVAAYAGLERAEKLRKDIFADGETRLILPTNVRQHAAYLISTEKAPSYITHWDRFSFSDFEELETDIKYRIFWATSTNWFLAPDSALPGNSSGFDSSPVDLSSLPVSQYPKLRVRGDFSTSDLAKTPILYYWQISYKTSQDTAISNVNFNIRGEDIVGTDSEEDPIYKFSENYTTAGNGEKQLSDIDADDYELSNFSRFGQDLELNTELTEMPVRVAPAQATTSLIYLESGDSLFVKVKDAETDNPIAGAELELTSAGLGYDEIRTTNSQGEGLFLLLEGAGDYHLEARAENYQDEEYNLGIWSSQNLYVNLERVE